MLAVQLKAATRSVSMGTDESTRRAVATQKPNVNTNTVIDSLVMGSLKTKAIMRGVSWALANCTATSSADETKMIKVNMDDARVARNPRVASGWKLESQPNHWSSQ